MSPADADYMEGYDPEFCADARDGDAAREAQAAEEEDDGSNPFAGWHFYEPPSDAYLRPEPPAARLMCGDGKARLIALAVDVVREGGGL